VNAQTGTSYTVLSGDNSKLITFSNGSATAVTLPQATGSFTSGWFADARNLGAGAVTITPTTSTIDGASTLVLTTGQSVRIVSDGTNYQLTAIVKRSGALVAADIPVQSYATLTDGSTVTWATAGAWISNAVLTMVHTTGSRTINLTGLASGCTGTLIVKQDGTGGATLVLGTNTGAYTNKVIAAGVGAITITATANAVDILAWTYDGTSVFWTYGQNYS
jgi:hypothetical protein